MECCSQRISGRTISKRHNNEHEKQSFTKSKRGEYRVHPIYDLKPKKISTFKQECLNEYTSEEVRVYVTKMYNTVKNHPKFEDKRWHDHEDIFDVVNFLYQFILDNFYDYQFHQDHEILHYSEPWGLSGDFHGIFVGWIWKLKDDTLRGLCKDAVHLLHNVNKIHCDFNFNQSMNQHYIEAELENYTYELEEIEGNPDSEPEEIQYAKDNLGMIEEIIKDYSSHINDNYHEFNERIVAFVDLKQEYETLAKKTNRIPRIAFEFLEHAITIIESGVNFYSQRETAEDGLAFHQNLCLYWSGNDDYYETITPVLDDYANNVGCEDLLTNSCLTEDTHNYDFPSQNLLNAIGGISNVTRFKIHATSLRKHLY